MQDVQELGRTTRATGASAARTGRAVTLPVDVGGLLLTLREVAVALGYATLHLRAGDGNAAGTLICNALRLLAVAEAEAQTIAKQGKRQPDE